MLGLKRGTVELFDHQQEWEDNAKQTIAILKGIFGDIAVDIQHVGSTAIRGIKAKPVIDIAVAMLNFDDVLALSSVLEEQGFICVGWEGDGKVQPMYQCGEFVSGEKLPRILTHFIHIVIADSQQWYDYINHRDYMNNCPVAAHEYESLKLRLAEENSNNYHNYFLGKQDYIQETVQIARLWNDFGCEFTQITPITKGRSGDKKYYIETTDGRRLLLRVADISEYDRKQNEFEMMKQVDALCIPMSKPVDFGVCKGEKNVYTLLTWIDGEELESILPALSETEQYLLGVKSGEILRKIHRISTPQNTGDWFIRYFNVIDERLNAFRAEGVPFEGDSIILDFLENNRNLLKGRPQCHHHGDYHEGNMILSEDKELFIIDWHTVDFENYGDPWIELARYSDNPYFTSGQINGYFMGAPPKEFWALFAYYLATSAITSIVWAKYFAPERLSSIIQLNRDVLVWFDNMKNPVPSWYLKGESL